MKNKQKKHLVTLMVSKVWLMLALLAYSGTSMADEFDDWNDGEVGKAMRAQMRATLDTPFSKASLLGSHNSYSINNKIMSRNQTLSMLDQLKLGASFIEFDIYKVEDHFELCHRFCRLSDIAKFFDISVPSFGNLSSYTLDDALDEVKDFLTDPKYSDRVFMLYIEDHTLDDADETQYEDIHNDLYNIINSKIGSYVYRHDASFSEGEDCPSMSETLTPLEMLDNNYRVVIWKGGTPAGKCAKDESLYSIVHKDLGGVSRTFEDQTEVCESVDGLAYTLNLLTFGAFLKLYTDQCTKAKTPNDIAREHEGLWVIEGEYVPCFPNVWDKCYKEKEIKKPSKDLHTLDFWNISDGDGDGKADDKRLEAGIWSWKLGEPSTGDCARTTQYPDGTWNDEAGHRGYRWLTTSCLQDEQLLYACRNKTIVGDHPWELTGLWDISKTGYDGSPEAGQVACSELGEDYVYSAPRNAVESYLLRLKSSSAGRNVWLNADWRPYNHLPEAKCKDVSLSLDSNGRAELTASQVNDGSSDPYGDPLEYSLSRTSFRCSDIDTGPASYTILTVTDDGNASDTCMSTVTVTDNSAPVPNLATLPDVTGECEANIDEKPTASDNCVETTITGITEDQLSYTEQGEYTVTWWFYDSKGNKTKQTQNVVIADVSAPEITCPDDIVAECESNNQAYVAPGTATAEDNCSDATVVSPAPGYYNLGTNWVKHTASDNWGNKAQCKNKVTVEDTTPPEIDCGTHDITPPETPIKFTATAHETCGIVSRVYVENPVCERINGAGKKIGNSKSCRVTAEGDTITIRNSGGIGRTIEWTAVAYDNHGNSSSRICSVQVLNPGKEKGKGKGKKK